MIVIDSSALIAIALEEPEQKKFLDVLNNTSEAFISTVSIVETRIVIYSRFKKLNRLLEDLLALPILKPVPPNLIDTETAYQGFIKYGKGQGHKAQLNICDLFSYALAKNRDLPLLFKGNDFALTDVKKAI